MVDTTREVTLVTAGGREIAALLDGVSVTPDKTTGSVVVTVTLLEALSRKRHLRTGLADSPQDVARVVRELTSAGTPTE